MNNYYDNEAISQSKLKKFIESKAQYKAIYIDKYSEQKDTENMKFGRFYHNYLYEFEKIRDLYAVVPDSKIVGGMMGSFIENFINLTAEEAYVLSGFKLPFNTIWKQFKDKQENQNYHNLLLEANGKTIVSDIDRTIVKKMKEIYIESNYVLATAIGEQWLIFREQEIYWKSSASPNLDLKIKADCIYIKPDFSKVIIEDAKSTEDLNLQEFINSIKKYRYDIQQSFYKLAVQDWIERKFSIIVDYDNIKFIFIPQRKKYPYDILDFIEIDKDSEQKAYLDWTRTLSQLDACITFDNWDIDRSSYIEGRKIVKVW